MTAEQLDEQGLQRVLDRIIAGGASGVFLLGTTGEGPCLSYRVRNQVIETGCEIVAGRVPVLVGVSDTSWSEALELAERSWSAGASAVVAAPPYYYPLADEELTVFLRDLASRSPLPVVLYNMPSCVKVNLSTTTLRTCLEHANVIGIKDSGGDLNYFRDLVALAREHRPDWRVLMGPEHLLLDSLRLGGNGGVCGGANVDPQLFSSLYRAVGRDDERQIQQLQQRVIDLGGMYQVSGQASAVIKGIKCALALLDICSDEASVGIGRCTDDERRHVAGVLERLKLDEPARKE